MSGVVVGAGEGEVDLDLEWVFERDPPERLDFGTLIGAVIEAVLEEVTREVARNSSNLPLISPTALTASSSPPLALEPMIGNTRRISAVTCPVGIRW